MICSKKRGGKIALYTWLAVIVMYILGVILWVIDVRNVVAEVKLTLLSNSTDTLDDIYSAAVENILRAASYQTYLYAYMVCRLQCHPPTIADPTRWW